MSAAPALKRGSSLGKLRRKSHRDDGIRLNLSFVPPGLVIALMNDSPARKRGGYFSLRLSGTPSGQLVSPHGLRAEQPGWRFYTESMRCSKP